MTRPLVILGTGGSAYDLLDIVEAINAVTPTWESSGSWTMPSRGTAATSGSRSWGRWATHRSIGERSFINAIGSDRSFRNRSQILAATGLTRERFATLVHPVASVSAASPTRVGC